MKIGVLEAIESYENISEFLDAGMFTMALAASLGAALVVSALYRLFYESRGTGSQIYKSFPLLALAITTLFLCIQVSIPLSLGLLGSLSIIRFRTPIKEPEEVGSLMLVIASSIAAATFHFAFMAIMLALAAVFQFAASRIRRIGLAGRDGMLTLMVPDAKASDAMKAAEPVLAGALGRHSVLTSASANGMTSIQLTFSGLGDACSLQKALRDAAPDIVSINVFLDRPGGFR
ncbi:MAG: DUF4956 domain-containing protein [Kiritimatiellae bacterium]|nr:DUF4956 domain-containing protein [Kiritimatiellia bacterium]